MESGDKVGSDVLLVFYMGYSIYGNEFLGINVLFVLVYYFVVGEGKEIDVLLDNNIVLFDLFFNFDGLLCFV